MDQGFTQPPMSAKPWVYWIWLQVETTPQEAHNLAADPKYAATVVDLKVLLRTAHPVPVQGGQAKRGVAKSPGVKTK